MPFAVHANILSSLQLLSLGYWSGDLLVTYLYAPIDCELVRLFQLDGLPKSRRLDVFWTAGESGYVRVFKRHERNNGKIVSETNEVHKIAEGEACRLALAGTLRSIIQHPGGPHDFHAEHCKNNEDLGNWVQLQVMSKTADQGYRCEPHDYYWTEVALFVRAGMPPEDAEEVGNWYSIIDLAIVEMNGWRTSDSEDNEEALAEEVEASTAMHRMACIGWHAPASAAS